jgi:hypothetical protein
LEGEARVLGRSARSADVGSVGGRLLGRGAVVLVRELAQAAKTPQRRAGSRRGDAEAMSDER